MAVGLSFGHVRFMPPVWPVSARLPIKWYRPIPKSILENLLSVTHSILTVEIAPSISVSVVARHGWLFLDDGASRIISNAAFNASSREIPDVLPLQRVSISCCVGGSIPLNRFLNGWRWAERATRRITRSAKRVLWVLWPSGDTIPTILSAIGLTLFTDDVRLL